MGGRGPRRESPAPAAAARQGSGPRPASAPEPARARARRRSSRRPRPRAGPPGRLASQSYDVGSMEPADVRARLDVATPVFEGPLELLLVLADREEVDILPLP